MNRWKIAGRVYLCVMLAFLYLPIAVLIAFSFNAGKSRSVWEGFSLKWYANLFGNEMVLKSLAVSLIVAFVSAIVATAVGTMAAVGINAMSRRARGAIMALSYVPVVNPEIITGVSLMLLFVVGNDGVSNVLSSLLDTEVSWNGFGLFTLLVAHITFNLPYVLFNVSPKLRRMDVRVYEAALDLGCNPRQAFFKVVLPELQPAIFSAFLICLTYSIDDFVISYFTSGTVQTLPIAIYSMTKKRVSPEINALSSIIFVVILTVILVSNAWEGKKEKRLERMARLAVQKEAAG
jgi:spermidine/putrescine transport system permease protein